MLRRQTLTLAFTASLTFFGNPSAFSAGLDAEYIGTEDEFLTEDDLSNSVVVDFVPGQVAFHQESEEAIRLLMDTELAAGPISNIVIAVWSDKPFPELKTKKFKASDAKLAERRGQEIKDFLESEYKFYHIDVYNMAKKPAKNAKTVEATMKTQLSRKDLPEDTALDTIIIRDDGGPSTAVVIVKHDLTLMRLSRL